MLEDFSSNEHEILNLRKVSKDAYIMICTVKKALSACRTLASPLNFKKGFCILCSLRSNILCCPSHPLSSEVVALFLAS
ncbi:hypothetical protein Tco_1146976 [Tanacetum coccineum]